MAGAISTLGAVATKGNVPLQEQLAIMGMLQATMSGSEAGTKYKAFISSTAKAGGQLGLNFLDANKQVKSMPAILDILKSKFGETIDAAEKVKIQKAFGTQEAVAVIDLLYNKTGALRDNIGSLGGAMQKGQGFTLDMAQTMNKDLGATLDKGRQRVRNLVEMIGGMFAPAVNKIIGAVSGFVLILMGWIGRNKELVKTVLTVAAGISAVIVGVTALAAAGAILGFVMTWIAGSVALISWPLWAIIGVVSLLYVAWRSNFGGIADIVGGFYTKVSLVVRGVLAVFRTLVDGQGVITGKLAEDIQAAGLVGLVTTVGRVVYKVQTFFGTLFDTFKTAWNFWADVSLYDAGAALIDTFVAGIKARIAGPMEAIKGVLTKVRNFLPFSDAKEGPLSQLTASGMAVMDTLAAGMAKNQGIVRNAAAAGMAGIALSVGAPDLALASDIPAVGSELSQPVSKDIVREKEGGRKIVIENLHITLPSVSDAGGFLKELQKLVESYDA